MKRSMIPLGVYIHVPFCRCKCDYCAFYSVPVGEAGLPRALSAAYADRLVREMEDRLFGIDASFVVDTIYFGGGTPSLLDPGDLKRLILAVRSGVKVEADAEITVELRPDDVTDDLIDAYREAGVNRAVLGVQTLSAATHRAIGRASAPCDAALLERFLSLHGMVRCVDLMIGAPGQTENEALEDVHRVLAGSPDHISVYLLAVEAGTPLAGRVRCDSAWEEAQAGIFECVADAIEERGYRRYEISNYAIPGRESRHNMKYWTFLPYLGFGAGAHSFIGGERLYNDMRVEDYLASDEVVISRDRRSRQSAAAEYLMTGLRLAAGVSLDKLEEELDLRLPGEVRRRAEAAIEGGFLEPGSGGTVKLTRKGVLLSNRVIYDIVEPLLEVGSSIRV